MPTPVAFDLARSALLVMDFQQDIIATSPLAPSDPEAQARFREAIATTRRVLVAAREAGLRVIHVRVAYAPGYPELVPNTPMQRYMVEHSTLVDGTPGADFTPALAPEDGEVVVTKKGISAFAGTDLDRMLRVAGIETLLLAGLVTHWVVEGTARDAVDRGFRVTVLQDCCASGGLARHEGSLSNLAMIADVATAEGFIAALDSPASV